VDDEPGILRVLERYLSREGHNVETFDSGGAALARLPQGNFEVVISDIRMPGMDGIQLLRAVRECDRDLPVLLVTGTPNIDTASLAIEYGAHRYLTKPFDRDELISSVARAVYVYRLARAKREALSLLGTSSGEGSDRAGLEASFERALTSLWMAYQPIVRAKDSSIYGYEALLRSEEATLPRPASFLDAAERLDQLPRLSQAVRNATLHTLNAKLDSALLFVNVHPLDLLDPSLYDPAQPFSQHASRIILEVTERASLDHVPNVRSRVAALRELGFRIAVDDFGAGYAGLSTFTRLEPDLVKVDMSLVRGIDENETKQKLLRSMASLCKDLGLLILAEGVETEAEREVLVSFGCDLLQGYCFARPERLL
jgi:EAL domain-containing protein (putative c-di-GMP-specific phosphodiesterase class I)